MDGIKTTVAESFSVTDAVLNLKSKAHDVRQTLAAVWNVQPTQAQPPSPEAAFSLDMKNDSEESVSEVDKRLLVDKVHFEPRGKYRSIVKLFIHYEFQNAGSWAMGTGWLITPDILVTAGHCSYEWSHEMGRATEVKAYIGYYGHQSEKDPLVQFRHVKRIVTTGGWVNTKGQKPFDVSFMQVETPFTGITPVKFQETPSQGSLVLGVVGYPGDKSDEHSGEKGARMYECFLQTNYDLSTQADTMLEYQIDTYGGNSGSPVLRERDLVSIGAHVYGGVFNSASVIGRYGNPYEDYIAAFRAPLKNDALNLVPVTGNKAISAPVPSGYDSDIAVMPQGQHRFERQRRSTLTKIVQKGRVPRDQNPSIQSQPYDADEENFMTVLKTVASALPAGLGIVGGPIGALAGFALSAASQLIPETTAAESVTDPSAIQEGSMERAILAEATLSALQSIELSPGLEESIFSDMQDTVMRALPVIRRAAPHVMGAMMEPALRFALDSLHKYNTGAAAGAENFQATGPEPLRLTFRYSSAIDQPADHQTEAFLDHLQMSLQRNSQESAMDGDSAESLVDIIKAGARLAGKGVLAAVKHGLPLLVDLMKQSGGAEAFDDRPTSGQAAHLLAADPLAQRALVADAALKAVMTLPPEQLQEEGLFDLIGDAFRTIAPIAMKLAPAVAGAINPTIGKILKNVLNQESASTGGSSLLGSALPRRGGNPGLSSKRSLQTLRNDSANSNERHSRFDQPGANRSQNGTYSRFGRQLDY